jgi:GT2 family glycosyltransferase
MPATDSTALRGCERDGVSYRGAAQVAAPSPRLSVLIPRFHSRETLQSCLESLARCRERIVLEALVVDPGHDDGTSAWLANRWPWVRVIEAAEPRDLAGDVNRVLAAASGDDLLLLNSVAEVDLDSLEAMMQALEDDPALAAIAPSMVDPDGVALRSCGRFPSLWTLICDHLGLAHVFPRARAFTAHHYAGVPMADLDLVDWASLDALMIPFGSFKVFGRLDENVTEDLLAVEWCRRTARKRFRICYLPAARLQHDGASASQAAPAERLVETLRARVYYFRKHHHGFVAWLAKGILCTSLALRVATSAVHRRRRAHTRVYARGVESVWAA